MIIDVSRTHVEFDINQGSCNGWHNVKVYANNELLFDKSTELEKVIRIAIKLPCEIRFNITGKDILKDTKIVDNKIVEDKFVEIVGVRLANLKIEPHVLKNLITYTELGGKEVYTNLAHSNGDLRIKFDTTDPIQWHIIHNSNLAEWECPDTTELYHM